MNLAVNLIVVEKAQSDFESCARLVKEVLGPDVDNGVASQHVVPGTVMSLTVKVRDRYPYYDVALALTA